MRIIFSAVAAIFGLIVGCLANTVEYRTRSDLKLFSDDCYCPDCRSKLRLTDQIPLIGYLRLGGKCRVCHKRISPRYPLVELGTAIVYCVFAAVFYPSVGKAIFASLMIVFAGIAASHICHHSFRFSKKKLCGMLLLSALQLPIGFGLMIITL